VYKICEKNNIFPTLMTGFYPRINMTIEYPDLPVYIGLTVPLEKIKEKPIVKFECRDMGLWTFMVVSRDSVGGEEKCHWLLTNMYGNNFSTGQEIIPYNINLGEKKSFKASHFLITSTKEKPKNTI